VRLLILKIIRFPLGGLGIASLTPSLLLRWFHWVKRIAERAASALELTTSAIVISEKLRELKDWASARTSSLLIVGLLVLVLVLYRFRSAGRSEDRAGAADSDSRRRSRARLSENGVPIPDEKTHFEKILKYCEVCANRTKIRIYVRLSFAGGKLVAAPESYLQKMTRIVKKKKLNVSYLFGIAPGDMRQMSPVALRTFFALYKPFAKVRVVPLTDENMGRYRLRDEAHVIVLLGKRIALRHGRDSHATYQKGRVLSMKERLEAASEFGDLQIASCTEDQFFRGWGDHFEGQRPSAALARGISAADMSVG
jgi:hypothetical protein